MRLLHTMIRVNDLDESIRFYCDRLGMKLLRRKDYPSGRFTLAFVGYDTEDKVAVIEFTHNWDTNRYDHGDVADQHALRLHGARSRESAGARRVVLWSQRGRIRSRAEHVSAGRRGRAQFGDGRVPSSSPFRVG